MQALISSKTDALVTSKIEAPSSCQKFHDKAIPINLPEAALNEVQKDLIRIPAKAGDLIIWRRELAHGNGANLSIRPRVAQYINMFPARPSIDHVLPSQESLHPETLDQRIRGFLERTAPHHKPGDPSNQEKGVGHPIMSPLGMRLLGAIAWEK
eukprot:TRINITY_DN2969_c0_g2_i2.p2 TRINITY_DN2969_c0_g2~~TRINITY_DN2969_c0_g2_i2.p2  ORF type:complete len:154 (+),score=39.69 TRINITY_DN2969_c0_g2_i2:607-1068(+)